MPMIDLTLPKGTLPDEAKTELMEKLTRTLLKWEGAKPENDAAQSIAWTFLNEAELVTVAGKPAEEPRYRVYCGVPQGSIGNPEKQGLVEEVTRHVLEAESPGKDPAADAAGRVWVIVNEITDGNWGGFGRIFRLEDIMAFAGASQEDTEARLARLREMTPA
jgi:phenylpyruvate tautomerase PptA (4-oxalocrotonate tautomerase family)